MRYYSSTATPKTLSVAIANGTATDMTVNNVTGLPGSFPYTLVIDPDLASEEIVSVTAVLGTQLTIVRGQDGTTGTAHAVGAVIKHMVTARDLQEPQNHMNTGVAVHGITGSVVGTTDAQTLTNKTINIASNTLTGVAPSTSPTFTGTVVLPSTTSIGTVSATELGYLDGVTSAVQTQLDAKSPAITGGASSIVSSNLTASRALASDGSGKVAVSAVTATELGYVSGVTSAIQTQLGTKAPLNAPTFTGTVVLPSTTSIGTVSSAEIGYLDGAAANLQVQINNSIGGSAGLVASVYANTTTTSFPSANTWYAVSFDTEILDSVTWWAAGVPSRVTPTVAGYYLVNGSVFGFAAAAGSSRNCAIRKNGTTIVPGSGFRHTEPAGTFNGAAINLPTNPIIVYMNGSSDYLELIAKSDQASLTTTAASADGQACALTLLKVA